MFCTGTSKEGVREEALSAGAQAYIVKPIDYLALQDVVDYLILKTEMKGLEARTAELHAIRDEINERLALIPLKLRRLEIQSIKAQDRAVKARAGLAFSDTGGARADFERLWPEAYEDALSRIQHQLH
jgi:CheY-like chemotaxis protein